MKPPVPFPSFLGPLTLSVLAGLFLAACQSTPTHYGAGGRSGGRVVEGVITSMNPTILRKNSGIGGFIGSSAGMIGGSMIGGDAAAHAAGAIGGLIVGTIAGNEAEKALSSKKAWELWIDGDNGQKYVMPVREPHPFVLDSRVKLVLGGHGHPVAIHPAP